jgi:hypothetical protein
VGLQFFFLGGGEIRKLANFSLEDEATTKNNRGLSFCRIAAKKIAVGGIR